MIIEKGLEIEKDKITPRINNKTSLIFFLMKINPTIIGNVIKAVILVPVANPKAMEDRTKNSDLLLVVLDFKYFIKKNKDIVTRDVR